jgi:GNAT superfamily N-acetyltransferase
MQSALAFRDATESDVPAVMSLVHSAYRGESSRRGWTTEADLLDGNRIDADTLLSTVSAPGSHVVLAYAKGSTGPPAKVTRRDAAAAEATEVLLACCHLADEGGGAGYFGLFAVRPDQQAAGIGRTVLAEAERRVAAEWGCNTLRMLVIRQRADLIGWYLRRGYAMTGRKEPFPYDDERFGLPRSRDLEFVELSKTLA